MTDRILPAFWDDSSQVTITEDFFRQVEEKAAKLLAFPPPPVISLDEWQRASPAPPCIVDRWYYEDVGVFIAPGGTGKTTLVLFQAIHIVLGQDLFGYEVINPGPVVIVTAEDSRESLVARLREIADEMGLSDEDISKVRNGVLISDVSGTGFKLTQVQRDTVSTSVSADRFIKSISALAPSIVFIDPAVSFGVGESRVNDAEQALVEAGRRIRNLVGCAVVYIHHTGKQNARMGSTDQYSGRGGSAFADGSRMVHVLQSIDARAWLAATGVELNDSEQGLILSRPKISHAPPQPVLYIKRIGYLFVHVKAAHESNALLLANAEKIFALLKSEVNAGHYPSGRSVEILPHGLAQKAVRDAITWLKSVGRAEDTPLTTGGRGGARSYLRPIDVNATP